MRRWRSPMIWLLERSLTRQPLEEVEADVPLEEPD
jgi:hypothetical protein